jgi:hypothetical protein
MDSNITLSKEAQEFMKLHGIDTDYLTKKVVEENRDRFASEEFVDKSGSYKENFYNTYKGYCNITPKSTSGKTINRKYIPKANKK